MASTIIIIATIISVVLVMSISTIITTMLAKTLLLLLLVLRLPLSLPRHCHFSSPRRLFLLVTVLSLVWQCASRAFGDLSHMIEMAVTQQLSNDEHLGKAKQFCAGVQSYAQPA